VLDSSGGSVNDSIALGRRWRQSRALTTVGISVETNTAPSTPASMAPWRIANDVRVPASVGQDALRAEIAHVRVHQIWMGDRAMTPGPRPTAQMILMIVEPISGVLAKYTFDMGGTGDLLSAR